MALACSRQESPERATSAVAVDTMARPPAWAIGPRYTNLTCTPDVLRKADVLTMRLTRPHGRTFMAVGPDRTQYIVVFYGEGTRDRTSRKSLAPPDSFVNMTELRLDPRTLTAGVWESGRDTNELLFQTPGFYHLIVGSDLETDGPSYAECWVRYAP